MAFMQKLFGPSKAEVWQQLSSEIGAQYVDGGFWKGDKVHANHGPWTVTLDLYVVSTGKSTMTYTRMRAPFVDPEGFRFTVYRKGIFSEIGKWFGMQDIDIGDESFDQNFILKTNQKSKLLELLSNSEIRDLISQQPEIYFSVKDDEGFFGPNFPVGTDELYFQVLGVIKDIDRLKLLYELFAETLDQLCKIGSATRDTPDVTL